jgi:hypothetical protein
LSGSILQTDFIGVYLVGISRDIPVDLGSFTYCANEMNSLSDISEMRKWDSFEGILDMIVFMHGMMAPYLTEIGALFDVSLPSQIRSFATD